MEREFALQYISKRYGEDGLQTDPATNTPKRSVTIPKSRRSRFVMYASSSSTGKPSMARVNGTNDSFFLLPEYAVDKVYIMLMIVR